MQNTTVDPAEIERFSRIADEWWNPTGKFAPLHRFNPVRLEFLRDRLCRHFGRDALAPSPLAGLRILDIGCGGGLICEPLARLGASVSGIDAAERNIAVAQHHAQRMELGIDYRYTTIEAINETGETFDAVLALEVVEHVADVRLFLGCCGRAVRPGGAMILATLNRTPKAFALAIVGAEYVLGWLPRGTHDWRKFVKPSEAAQGLRAAGLNLEEITGVAYNVLGARWHLAPGDTDVNYMMCAVRPG